MKTRKLLCMILVVAAISCFSSMLSFAFSATSSNALMATSSNAWPMDDFVELDDFDSIERPVLMNAGELDGFESTVPASFLSLGVGYSNMSGVVKYVQVPFNSQYYASLALPSDCASVNQFFISISKSGLPSFGRY